MGVRHDHWIDGEASPPSSGDVLGTTDPVTREAGDEVAAGSLPDVDRAVASAVQEQQSWARESAADRSAVLHAIADRIERHDAELMELERFCTGKLPSQLRLEIDMSAGYFRYYAGVL